MTETTDAAEGEEGGGRLARDANLLSLVSVLGLRDRDRKGRKGLGRGAPPMKFMSTPLAKGGEKGGAKPFFLPLFFRTALRRREPCPFFCG